MPLPDSSLLLIFLTGFCRSRTRKPWSLPKNSCCSLTGFGNVNKLAEALVHPLGDVACEFQMLGLVLADRHV